MELELLNTSVVILAQEHNPTILHPAFLAAQRIVPADWQVADKPLCTPAFSIARYNNGISFTVESNRFVVTEEKPAGKPGESMIAAIAVLYAETLPHVRYKALGVNFNGYCLHQEPERFVIERFLKAGPWNDEVRPMKALGSRFVYDVEDAVLRFGLDGGQVRREEQSQPAILISGNFHSELPGEKPLEAIRDLAGRWATRLARFGSLSRAILGMEEPE
jgi:hypothetical protein